MENYVRVRHTLRGRWMWELVTHDGHVASRSEEFAEREPCEAEALTLGHPVKGLSGRKKALPGHAASKKPGLNVVVDASDLWRWEYADARGDVVIAGERAFLTREEAQADAARVCPD